MFNVSGSRKLYLRLHPISDLEFEAGLVRISQQKVNKAIY